MKIIHLQHKNYIYNKILKYLLVILISLLQGQSYIEADPIELNSIEYKQFLPNQKNYQVTLFRPFFINNKKSNLNISIINEFYFNNGSSAYDVNKQYTNILMNHHNYLR